MRETPTRTASSTPEENVYAGVYHVLLVGMFVSTGLFLIGMLRALLHRAYFPLSPEWVRRHLHWRVVLHGLATFDPMVLMVVATVVLILTPILRVVVSIHAFYLDRDYKYVVVTSIVLAVMVLTLVLAKLGLQ